MNSNLHQQYTPRQEDVDMTDLLEALVDQGLTRGLLAMQYTDGISVSTTRKYDVAAVAALRLLDTLPGHVSVHDVIEGLHRRAITLAPEVQ
jgi:aconitase B